MNSTSGITILVKPVSSKCNLACSYCFYKDAVKHRNSQSEATMDSEISTDLVKQAFSIEESFVSFIFQGGEPLLAGLDYYYNFLRLVKKYNIKNIPVFYSIQTNGTLITDEWIHLFQTNDWLVDLSLDGCQEDHDFSRSDKSGKGSFLDVMKAINALKLAKVNYNILAVVTSENYQNISNTYRFFKDQGFTHLQFISCLDFLDNDNILTLSPLQWAAFQIELFDLWYKDWISGEYTSIRHFDNYINLMNGYSADSCAQNGVCGSYFVCENDGTIYPCDYFCLDETKLGMIQEDTLQDMQKNDKYQQFLAESLLIETYCISCPYYSVCRGGCKKDRTADLNANYYCEGYKIFFKAVWSRMQMISKQARNGYAGRTHDK